MVTELNENSDSDLPKCIKDLLVETPSAIAKLCALWDGLTAETQVKILSEIKAGRYSGYFTDKIYVKAVKSKNPYVRYLAAKDLSFGEYSSDEINALEQLIKDDPEPLVKYSSYEDSSSISGTFDKFLKDPKAFFVLSQDARLAKVRSMSGGGEDIAAIMRYAIDNLLESNEITEQELFEILLDYLNKPEFRSHCERDYSSYDGYGEYLKGKDLGVLWGLVPKVPPSCSYVLIKYLPSSGGFKHDIPEKITNKLDESQLKWLLGRDDIGFEDLRKKIFWEHANSVQEKDKDDNEESWSKEALLSAAISHNFQLSYDDFAKILCKPEKKKIKILNDLTSANDLKLYIYEAIHDVICNCDVDATSWQYAEFAKYPFERRLKTLKNYQLKKELLELRLYRLAKTVVPWKDEDAYELPEKLQLFLNEEVVPGNTWDTFVAFSKAWPKGRIGTDDLEKLLPSLYDIDGAEDDNTDDEISIENDDNRMFAHELSSLKSEISGIKSLIYAVIVLLILFLIFR